MLKRLGMIGVLALVGACNRVPDSELAAKVNGEGITKKDFETQVERNMARYKGQGQELPPGIDSRIRESVLRRMIDDAVTEQKAKSLGLDVTAQELDAKFKEYKDRFRTQEAFDEYLKRSGNTAEAMRDDLRRNLLRDRVVEKLSGNVDVADDEVQKYYTENIQRFTEREQVKASRILVRVAPNATDAEKKAALKEAKSVRAKAAAANADFAAIATQSSKAPEASRGGDLGYITRGRMTPEFDNVAFTLKPNTVSDVVQTALGYEIIKVFEQKAERQRPLDEVKESIKNSLLARKRNEKRRDVLRQLKQDAKVDQLVKFEQQAAAPGMMPQPTQMAQPGVPGAPAMAPGAPAPVAAQAEAKPAQPVAAPAAQPTPASAPVSPKQ